MRKANELRQYLADHVPHLKDDPAHLLMFVSEGRIACRAGSLSFQWAYELEITITDFGDHADTLVIPLLAWIATNQPDLLVGDKADKALSFVAEIIDHGKADVQFKLTLSENVIVTLDGATHVATHCAEPALDDLTGPSPWTMYGGGVEVQ